MKEIKRNLFIAVCLLIAFVLWTLLVSIVDVQAIGPKGSTVGFATLNGFVRDFVGTNMFLYTVTDWLGLVPFFTAFGFAILGLTQWIKRKSFLKVDFSILILGGFYIVVIMVYVFFETVVINYRPVLINGLLEASYPSSTTMLVMCVMPTLVMQLKTRIKNRMLERCLTFAIIVFTLFMVIGRLISGVHWLTDIIGGAVLSTSLVMMYYAVSNLKSK